MLNEINIGVFQHSSVAQLVEQLTVNQLVAGSSPARGANLAVTPLKVTTLKLIFKFRFYLKF